jgi:hypothetical protein
VREHFCISWFAFRIASHLYQLSHRSVFQNKVNLTKHNFVQHNLFAHLHLHHTAVKTFGNKCPWILWIFFPDFSTITIVQFHHPMQLMTFKIQQQSGCKQQNHFFCKQVTTKISLHQGKLFRYHLQLTHTHIRNIQ